MLERFTDRARRAVVLAQEEARLLGHDPIGTEHILLGLLCEGGGVAAKALESLGIHLDAARQRVAEIIGRGQQAPSGPTLFTPRGRRALELALHEAVELGHDYIGTEHILLGVIRVGEGGAAQVLARLGADPDRLRQQAIQILHYYQGGPPAPAVPDRPGLREERLAAVRALLARFVTERDTSSLLEPEAFAEAVRLAETLEDDDGDLQTRLLLGYLHWHRACALPTGQLETDLEKAIAMFTPCFAGGVDGLPQPLLPVLAERADDIAAALFQRISTSTDATLLAQGVDLCQRIVDATPPESPNRAAVLSNLGTVLLVRYRRTRALADLEAAIHALETAAAAAPAAHPSRAEHLYAVADALRTRFERRGTLADLEAAIAAARAALEATPAGHPGRTVNLSDLGTLLRDRFTRTGALADAEAAAELARAALEATPAGHPHRATYLNNLSAALFARFGRSGSLDDLGNAIKAIEAAIDATPADDPRRATWLSNLGVDLQARFVRTGAAEDLEAAIQALETAVAARAEHPDRAVMLSNLADVLRARFGRTGALDDLNAAIEAIETALPATPADHPNRAILLWHIGHALNSRFERIGARDDLDAAVASYVRAAESGPAMPTIRIRAARRAAALIAPADPGRAADLLHMAVGLLPEVAPRGLDRGDQQHAIGEFAGLARDAASLTLADPRSSGGDRAARALGLLEAGRAVLLSQALETRGDLTDLRQRHPELAARFAELRDLHDQDSPSLLAAPSGTTGAIQPKDRQELAGQLAATMARIRALEGFASFGLPPSRAELLAQAAQGPVVTFAVSRHRSDALLLTADGITALSLPGLGRDALIDRIVAFHGAVRMAGPAGASTSERRAAQATLLEILEWLWDTAAEPVLAALGYHSQPQPGERWPRVWWAPGGLLDWLPLHAAGYHTIPPDDHGRRAVMDRVVSSCTPTIRALRHARQHDPAAAGAARALIVAMPTTPGVPGRLDNVPAEASLLRGLLPDPVLLTEPAGSGDTAPGPVPTKAAVLANLRRCSIAHFACHGAIDPEDPSKSLLLLHDHDRDPFTVASLASARLDQAQLAYLSACRTAFTGTELMDEAIHLGSAFQLAGFPRVIGTLWEINDAMAVDVAEGFYLGLRTSDGTFDASLAADALHRTIRAIRDTMPASPSLWASYLHIGA